MEILATWNANIHGIQHLTHQASLRKQLANYRYRYATDAPLYTVYLTGHYCSMKNTVVDKITGVISHFFVVFHFLTAWITFLTL